MNSQEYTQWLKGFLDAVDGYNISKKQFDSIREKLKEVEDTPIGISRGDGGFGTPGTPYWGGTVTFPANYSTPLTGTITTNGSVTTTQFPSGTNVSYTDTNRTNNIFATKPSEDDEKLLLD